MRDTRKMGIHIDAGLDYYGIWTGTVMHDVAPDNRDPDELRDHIRQLHRTIARLEERVIDLDRLAHLDPLLEVMNRRGLMRELERMIARYDRHNTPAAVLFVDLDGLKALNDSLGHQGGDAALIHVSKRLLSGLRITDSVGRLGGDEFCILLECTDEPSAIETANRLVELVASDDLWFEGQRISLSVSIGMTLVERGDTPTGILARADQAMYRVKAAA